MNIHRNDVGEVMNHIAETGTSMNYRYNQKPEKIFFPVVLMVLMSVVILLMMSALVARTAYADTTTLVPDGVIGTGVWTGVSAGNLSDSPDNTTVGDGTFATITTALDTFTVTMSNNPAYSGATINTVTIWVRTFTPNGAGNGGNREYIDFGPAGALSGVNTTVDRTAFSGFSYQPPGPFSSTDIDNLAIDVATTNLAAGEEVQVSEVWVVIDYTPVAGTNELNACDNCHTQPPVEGASRNATAGAVVGSHANHATYACTICHPNNAVLNHRGGLGTNGTEGRIDMLASIQGGTYSLGSAGFLQDNEDGTGLGTCSDVSCHGGAATTTPQWGDAAGLNCDGCHGAPPATNAHTTHYTAKGWASPDLTGASCVPCHRDNTPGGGGHSDVTDGIIVIDAGLSASGTSPAISCGTTANGCHNGSATPNWNTTNIACVDCHTVGGANTGTLANPVSGLHNMTQAGVQKHDDTIAGGCAACHTKASISGHWDGSNAGDPPNYTDVQVGVSGGITNGTYTDDGGTGTSRGTCATSCHTDGGDWSRQWSTAADSTATTSGSARCDVCHGQYQSIGGGWRAGTSHGETFGGVASSRGSGHNSLGGASNTCEDCHLLVTDGFVGNLYHEDGLITINNAGAIDDTTAPPRVWCSDCHTNDGDFSVSGTHTYQISTFPLDEQSGPNDPLGSCTGCHGTGGANYWPDNSTVHVANDQPGEHLAHMTLLARRVYNQSTAQLIADAATDTKQKALCDYCHKATTQDATHNNGTANVFPSVANALRFQDGTGDTGTLASYDGGVSGTCSSVDCHNSKASVPGTYGWYDAGAADCDMCHTPGGHAEDFANPASGLHNIVPTTSGVTHSDTLTACDTCHALIPDNSVTQSSSHIDGTFPADTNSNTDRYLFADYVDGTPGTCSGGNSGAVGCHDGNGEVGTWKRRWSLTADDGGTVVCDNCHGGVNGEGTWTFGSNNTIGDNNMSHDRNWDGAGALEVIGQHSADTSSTDRCNTCHVYGDVEYGAFGWGGASNHGNNKIDMNDSLGYSRSGGDAYGCTSNCHTTPGSHLTESSNWTLGALTGPSLGCDSCHGGASPAAGVDSSSPHVVSTFGGSFISCGECHPGDGVGTQHTATGVVSIPNNTNVGINYVNGVNSYAGFNGIVLGGTATTGSTEAEICWNCHDFNGNGNLNDANEPNEWGTNTGSTYDYGTLDDKSWFSANWASGAGFTYKNGGLTTALNANGASTHGTNGGAQGVDAVAEIGCSYCHDVHDTAGGVNGAPFLRGSWIGNRYTEDGAPQSGFTYAAGVNKYTTAGSDAPPRTHAGANTPGGWQIDANNGDPNSGVTFAEHAGLCSLCHGDGDAIEGEAADVTAIEGLWSGHVNTIAGGSHNGTNNIFSNTIRNGTGNFATGMWMGAMNSVGYNGSWMHGMRTDSGEGGNGVTTGDANEMLVNGKALAYQGFAWTVTVDDNTVDDTFHNFTCSKCHNPHASRLPRLMITNCLDVSHNTWDDDYTGATNWATWDSYARNNIREFAYTSTAQNCHRYADMPPGGAVEEPGWNSVTPW